MLAVSSPVWLGWVGSFLVKTDEPFHADMVVVLAGDWAGHRILKGGELVEQGYAPQVLVSGPIRLLRTIRGQPGHSVCRGARVPAGLFHRLS